MVEDGFDNWPRFVGVIEQNKISNSFDKYCRTWPFQYPDAFPYPDTILYEAVL